jgi:ABC-type sugar transport system ATPase subunit
MLCGDVKPVSGTMEVKGAARRFASVSEAVDAGIALMPEDRKAEGLFMDYSIDWNIPSMSFKRLARFGIVSQKRVDALTDKYVAALKIKTPSTRQIVRLLSGGNQQKVVVARALAAESDILIFDEPTRGIDVGAKQEIYKLMNQLAEDGNAIIMITSDMEELLGMSDRIVVLYEGRKTGELEKNEFSQDRVLELASGIAS